VPTIILVVFGRCEQIVASQAPDVKKAAPAALTDVMEEGNLRRSVLGGTVHGPKRQSKLWIPFPKNSTTPATSIFALRPS
jgi:hypothetical protein